MFTPDTQAFYGDSLLYGNSLSKELLLVINDELTGVVCPFPIVFTYGYVPRFWILDAFDLLKDELETPFLPVFVIVRERIRYIKVGIIEEGGNSRGELPESAESH